MDSPENNHHNVKHVCQKRSMYVTYCQKRKVREATEINRLKLLNETDKTFKVLNRHNGNYVTTNSRKSLFRKIENYSTVILTLDYALV